MGVGIEMEVKVLFDRLFLVGTIHVSPESKRQVRELILKEKPEIIAVELDQGRYEALLEQPKKTLSFGELLLSAHQGSFSTNLMVWLIAHLEQGLGEEFGVIPGEEMLVAIQTAKEIGSKYFLIDQPLPITLQRFQSVGLEKNRLIIELVRGILGAERDIRHSFLELETNPNDILQELMGTLHKKFPGISKILIQERDAYIAKRVSTLLEKFPDKKICVVLGLGHLDGVKKRIHTHFSK
ncbi:MAG: TraB domain-containing protein [Promethearchaeota archaeon]